MGEALRIISSTFVHFHPLTSSFINFHPYSSTFINFHHGSGESCDDKKELQMLSSVPLNCQVTKIVINSGSQLSEL